jgi:hypothetical protein
MEQLTSEFWEAMGAVDILLLLIAGFVGWKIRSIVHGAERNADDLLKLAREKQQELTEKMAVAITESMKLQEQLTLNEQGFIELTALKSSIRSTIDAIKRANNSSETLRSALATTETRMPH